MGRPKRSNLDIALDAEAALNSDERVMFDQIRKRLVQRVAGPSAPAPRRKPAQKPKPAPEASNG